MTTTPQALTGQAWNPIAEARTKYPGLASESEDKIGEFLSQPQNFRSSFPEYGHLDDQTIARNMANVRAIAPLKTDVPPNPIMAPGAESTNTGERLAGGGGAARLPERRALYKEAGGPLGIPLVAGARALETDAATRRQQQLINTARGVQPAPILHSRNQRVPDTVPTGDAVPTTERMGADTLRMGAGMLTPSSLAIAAAAPIAPTLTGAGLALHGGYNAVKNTPKAIKGNPEAAAAALSGGAEAAGGAALGAGGIAEGARDVKAVVKPLRRAVESNLGLKTLGIVKPEPVKALTQAIQPGVNIPRAQESMPIAGSDLQAVKKAGLVTDREGNPVTEFKSNGDLLHGVRAAKQYIWNALEQRTGSVAKLSADTNAVADAMEKSISKRTAEQYPEIAKKVQARADTYRGLKSFRDIENAIQDANDDLRGYYKRSTPTDSPITAETAATEAEVKVLRKMLDDGVEKLTGEGTADLKRRYGALRDVERASAKQYAVETRQKGANLWEGLAALRAAGDFVSGNVLGAAKAGATMAVGKRLGLVRTPAWLIDQAFQGPKAFEPSAAITPPPGVKIAGELGPGAPVTPPPADTSGPIRNAPQPRVAEGTRATRLGLLLPEKGSTTLTPHDRAPARADPREPTKPPPLKIQPTSNRVLTAEREGNATKAASTLKPIFGKVENVPGEPGSAPPAPEPPPTLSKPPEKPNAPTLTKKGTAKAGAQDPVRELQDLKIQMRDLDKKISGTKSAYTQRPMIARYRKLEARANELSPQRSEGGAGSSGEADGPTPGTGGAATKPVPENKDVLPGMAQAVEENKAAAGKHQAEEMTRQSNRPAENIAAAAGEMETKSPLFRGTEASPQREIFGKANAPAMKRTLPTVEEYEDKLHAGGMNAADAYKQAVDDIKTVNGEYTLPEGSVKQTRERIAREMAKETPAKQNAPTLKPTSKAEQLKTYNSLTDEQRQAVDAQFEHLPHMPQLLREGRSEQLAKHGPAGTYVKERLAKELLEDAKKPAREPGED